MCFLFLTTYDLLIWSQPKSYPANTTPSLLQIVFHFKHSVSGATSTPEMEDGYIWLPPDATLHWTVKPVSEENKTLQYHVTAFRGHLQEFVDPAAVSKDEGSKNAFSSFLSLFSKSKVTRSKLSCADPTNIVNSCGEKFIKGK